MKLGLIQLYFQFSIFKHLLEIPWRQCFNCQLLFHDITISNYLLIYLTCYNLMCYNKEYTSIALVLSSSWIYVSISAEHPQHSSDNLLLHYSQQHSKYHNTQISQSIQQKQCGNLLPTSLPTPAIFEDPSPGIYKSRNFGSQYPSISHLESSSGGDSASSSFSSFGTTEDSSRWLFNCW